MHLAKIVAITRCHSPDPMDNILFLLKLNEFVAQLLHKKKKR
jgi:hypothetical protein